jgi:hypothetical protein
MDLWDELSIRWSYFKKAFWIGFNDDDKYIKIIKSRSFFMGRHHYGTNVAVVFSAYNLFLIRQ